MGDLRKNEIKSLEEKMQKENQARICDIAKLDGKLDTENNARKTEIANLNNFARTENDGRIKDISDLNARCDKETSDRIAAEGALNTRVDTEIIDRENAVRELQNRMDEANANRDGELDDLRKKLMRENLYLKNLAGKPLSIYFDAYRTKAYDGGGEENLTFQGCSVNVGGGMDPDTGLFTAPLGGSYMFVFHIATYDNKKALLSIRLNGEEVASVFDQNHKDNHKNSMWNHHCARLKSR